MQSTASSKSFKYALFSLLTLSPKGAVPSIPGRCCIDNGLVSRLRNSTLGKPESLKLGCKQIFLIHALQGNLIFNILDSKQTYLLCSEGRSLSSKVTCFTKILEIIV